MEHLNLNPTLGALEIGYTISTALFGVTTVQTYLYYDQFPDDPRETKTLVAVVWLLELAHEMSLSQGLYQQIIADYGQPEKLLKLPLGFVICLVFGACICLIVQCFFAHRVWVVTKKKVIPIICLILSSLRFISTVLLAVEMIEMVILPRCEDKWEWLITFILVDGACVDVLIAASLCYNLIQRRHDAFTVHTLRLLDRLILWTIQTGLITSLAAVAMTICFLTMKSNFIWIGVYVFLARLFANSLLATLNSRSKLREMGAFGMREYSGGAATGNCPDHRVHFRTSRIIESETVPPKLGTATAGVQPEVLPSENGGTEV